MDYYNPSFQCQGLCGSVVSGGILKSEEVLLGPDQAFGDGTNDGLCSFCSFSELSFGYRTTLLVILEEEVTRSCMVGDNQITSHSGVMWGHGILILSALLLGVAGGVGEGFVRISFELHDLQGWVMGEKKCA
jgi:hypothetical protein